MQSLGHKRVTPSTLKSNRWRFPIACHGVLNVGMKWICLASQFVTEGVDAGSIIEHIVSRTWYLNFYIYSRQNVASFMNCSMPLSLQRTERSNWPIATLARIPSGFPKAPLIPVWSLSAPAHQSILLILRTWNIANSLCCAVCEMYCCYVEYELLFASFVLVVLLDGDANRYVFSYGHDARLMYPAWGNDLLLILDAAVLVWYSRPFCSSFRVWLNFAAL